jgi:hypothetical protein
VSTVSANHKHFLSVLGSSIAPVLLIAGHFVKKGWLATIPGIKSAPSARVWKDYADNGDLFVRGPLHSVSQRIEVKRRSINFTGEHDWPYGDKFIVCSKQSFDRAERKPEAYYILNRDMTHVAIVRVDSFPSWTVEKRKDSRRNSGLEEFYFCPIDLVKWKRLDEI